MVLIPNHGKRLGPTKGTCSIPSWSQTEDRPSETATRAARCQAAADVASMGSRNMLVIRQSPELPHCGHTGNSMRSSPARGRRRFIVCRQTDIPGILVMQTSLGPQIAQSLALTFAHAAYTLQNEAGLLNCNCYDSKCELTTTAALSIMIASC